MAEARLSSIQRLRGVAVLAVVVHHLMVAMRDWPTLAIGSPSPAWVATANLGASGVDLFFVISGFVMAHVAARQRAGGAARFLADRMIRILPMFWLTSALYIGWMLATGAVFPSSAYWNTVSVVPLSGGNLFPALYVGWTLAFEVMFYGITAGVIMENGSRPALWLTASMMLAAMLGLSPRLHAIAPLVFNPIVGEFALGAAAWLVWSAGKSRASPLALILLGVLLLLQTLVNPWTPGFSVHPALVESGASSVQRLLFWGVPCALIVTGAALARSSAGWVPRGLGRLGDASYSIYLCHPLAFELLRHLLSFLGPPISQPLVGAMLLTAALCFGLAVHALIERPLLRMTRQGWAAIRRGVDRPAVCAA